MTTHRKLQSNANEGVNQNPKFQKILTPLIITSYQKNTIPNTSFFGAKTQVCLNIEQLDVQLYRVFYQKDIKYCHRKRKGGAKK